MEHRASEDYNVFHYIIAMLVSVMCVRSVPIDIEYRMHHAACMTWITSRGVRQHQPRLTRYKHSSVKQVLVNGRGNCKVRYGVEAVSDILGFSRARLG